MLCPAQLSIDDRPPTIAMSIFSGQISLEDLRLTRPKYHHVRGFHLCKEMCMEDMASLSALTVKPTTYILEGSTLNLYDHDLRAPG